MMSPGKSMFEVHLCERGDVFVYELFDDGVRRIIFSPVHEETEWKYMAKQRRTVMAYDSFKDALKDIIARYHENDLGDLYVRQILKSVEIYRNPSNEFVEY